MRRNSKILRAFALAVGGLILSTVAEAHAAPCMTEILGQGRVASISDARTFRMQDGREVRLTGVEEAPPHAPARNRHRAALDALIGGREVILHGSAKPDRYGRITAFAFLPDTQEAVQSTMIGAGHLLAAPLVGTRECATSLLAREADARQSKRGLWMEPAALKNTEIAGDILTEIGQFVVAEGRVLSVREAGATFYVNFGRRWTQDFAVTISRRNVAVFEAAGVALKLLERRRVRVRGWVEQRGGPRIHVSAPWQIEVLDINVGDKVKP